MTKVNLPSGSTTTLVDAKFKSTKLPNLNDFRSICGMSNDGKYLLVKKGTHDGIGRLYDLKKKSFVKNCSVEVPLAVLAGGDLLYRDTTNDNILLRQSCSSGEVIWKSDLGRVIKKVIVNGQESLAFSAHSVIDLSSGKILFKKKCGRAHFTRDGNSLIFAWPSSGRSEIYEAAIGKLRLRLLVESGTRAVSVSPDYSMVIINGGLWRRSSILYKVTDPAKLAKK